MGGDETPDEGRMAAELRAAEEAQRQRLRTRITRWVVALLAGSLLAGIWVGDTRWLWTAAVLFVILIVVVAPNYEATKAEVARRAEGPEPGRPNPSGRT